MWADGLEGTHLEIAGTPDTPLHVLAGPGTGKTFAMMRRVARLLEEGVSPADLIAFSFTRTAARDLREQLQRLEVPGATLVQAGTLHSFCFSFLAKAAVFPITNRVPRPLLSYEMGAMITDLAEEYGGRKKVGDLIAAYEAAWSRLQTDEPGGPTDAIDAAFHASILDWLRYHRSMLVGELIPLALGFIRQNPAFPELPRYAHVLVDEYQDLNRAEQELIDAITDPQGTLTVIGDDCQSIFSFRHANPEGIRNFPETHENTRSLTITECKRCPGNIVAMSNALIAHDRRRSRPIPLEVDPTKPEAQVYIVQHEDIDDEVECLADFIAHYLRAHPDLPAGQALVLTPRRFLGNRIRDALIARAFNSLSYFTEDPLDSGTAAKGFCLLTLLVDPSDRAALRAWLGMEGSGLVGGYRRVRVAAEERQQEPADVLRALDDGTLALPYTAPVLERWRELQRYLEELNGTTGLDLVRTLWSPDDEACNDLRLMAEAIALQTPDPKDILPQLREDVTQPYLPDSRGDIIRVMSLHKSKGLTASLVVLAGCVAGALPRIDEKWPQALRDARYEEQRRLFYVAITRAADTLVISSAVALPYRDAKRGGVAIQRGGRRGGEPVAMAAASPFIEELGATAPAPTTGRTWRGRLGF